MGPHMNNKKYIKHNPDMHMVGASTVHTSPRYPIYFNGIQSSIDLFIENKIKIKITKQ